MVLRTQRTNFRPPALTPTPPVCPQKQDPQPTQSLPPPTAQAPCSSSAAPPASAPPSLPHILMERSEDGFVRFKHAAPNGLPTTPSSTPPAGSGVPVEHPKDQFTAPYSRPQRNTYNEDFVPFGIPAERTRALRKGICRDFVNPATRCSFGFRCKYIHPRDRSSYVQKMFGALTVDDSPSSAGSPEAKTEQQPLASSSHNVVPNISPSLLLSSDGPSPTEPPSLTSEPPELATDRNGWDSNGAWQSISKAESWTTSPASSNDPLFPTSSGSSSPTTTTLEATDDDKENSAPVTRQPLKRPLNSAVCVLFQRRGTCLKGDVCPFKHVRDMPPHAASRNQTIGKVVQPPKQPESAAPQNQAISNAMIQPEPAAPPNKVISNVMIQPEPVALQNKAISNAMIQPEPAAFQNKAISVAGQPIDTASSPSLTRSSTPAVSVRPSDTSSALQLRTRRPRPRTNELCHRWLRDACQYGYACRYVHGNLEYDDDPVDRPSPSPAGQPPSAPPEQLSTVDEFLLTFTLHDHMRVQCSAGFDIQRIQTAFESSTLLVSNISYRVRPNHLRETLSSYGIVEDLRMPTVMSTGVVVRVTYSTSSEAQKAQNALNGTKMYGLTITARVANSGNTTTASRAILKDTSVRISWEAPAKEVFAGYSTREQADKALQISRINPLNGHYLRGEIYEGMPAVDNINIHFYGVPIDVDKADLVRFVNPVDVMWTRPNYSKFEDAERFIKSQLHRFGPESVEILPPPYRDGGMIRAWASFPSASKAKEVARHLDGLDPKCTGYTPIRAKHVQSLSYVIIPEQWAKLGPAIEELQVTLRGKLVGLTVSRRDSGHRAVRLSGDDQKELAHLKNQFERVLKGEVVRCDGKIVYDSYFTRAEGEEFLKDLAAKNPAIYFVNNVQRQCICVHGCAVDRARFMSAIVTKVKEFRAQRHLEIPLPGSLLGRAIQDQTFKDLQRKYGLDNCYIDVFRRVVRVRGDFSLYQKFKRVVDEIAQRIPTTATYVGPTCPICFDKPSSPITLQCGHAWCHGCLSHYFRSATEQKSFPVKCLGNEGRCGVKIAISVAKQVLTGDELLAIVDAAFLAHTYARPKEFHFCPSPDCPQVYRTTEQKATLQCPSCLTSICTRCHSHEHDELQCADEVQDELFRKWMKEHDVKHCPSCDAPIEKIEGCNHLTCTRCQTHICWQCMQTFPGGEGIYGHMREVHGTFGLGPMFV